LPGEESACIALRTQRIIAYETHVTNTTDPVGGSEYIENLTDEIEDGVIRSLDEIEKTGGTLSAIETRWVQQQISNLRTLTLTGPSPPHTNASLHQSGKNILDLVMTQWHIHVGKRTKASST